MKKLLYTFLITVLSVTLFAQTKVNSPVLIAPEDNAINQMPDVLLDWNPVSGIGQVSYEAQLADEDTFTNPVIFNVSVTSTSTENLFFGKTYYWRVRATDDIGTSDWSETFSFTVFSRLDLNKPDDGSDEEDPDVELGWKNKVGGAAGTPISGFTYVDCQVDTSYFWGIDNQVPVTDDLFGTFFLSENDGYAVGQGGVILHNDGTTWTEETSNTTNDLYAIYMFSGTDGVAVGKSGTVVINDGGTWEVATDIPTEEDLFAISVLDENNTWVVGKGGTILYADASGPVVQESPTTKDLKGVFAVSADDVWAVGKTGTIIHFDGSEWTEIVSPTSKSLSGVYFTSASDGWAVGKSGTIIHYDGTEWTLFESDADFNMLAIYLLNANSGLIVGEDGSLASYNGSSWIPGGSGSVNDLNAVFMLDENNYWLAGNNGTVVFWTGAGFNSPAAFIRTTTIDSTSVAMNQLLFDTKYYWRVRARHDLDTSEWSAERSFTTIDKVTLTEPANNSSDQMLDVVLKWQAISGTFSYIYEVCRDPDFTVPCTAFSDVNQVSAQGLMYDSTYYWRVKAAHTKDTTEWSEAWSFTTINTVNLVSPNNGDTTNTLPEFEWEGQTGTDGYVVEYDMSDGFENAEPDIVDAPSTTYNVIYPLEKGKTYYWRVKAFHDGDTTGWSEVRHFITEPEQGIDAYLTEKSVSVFPNPAKDELNISVQSPEKMVISFKVLNLLGEEIINNSFNFDQGTNIRKIDVSNLENGVYVVQVKNEENVYSHKLIIDK